MFRFDNVKYKTILRVDRLDIPAGKTTCIIGESGSGKSTLLKLLNAMIEYEEGSLTYLGDELKTLDPVSHRREALMLPQTPIIFPGTVKDNLLIGLKFSGKEPEDNRNLLEELKLVNLQKSLEEDSAPLSGGEKQRLALARIMLMKPKVLLLDEPTSALDEKSGAIVINRVLQYIKREKKTMVMVTHSYEQAKRIGHVIVTVNKGRIADVEEVA